MNANKTQCIFIATRHLLSKISTYVKIELQDDIIEPVTKSKNLGVFFDRYMTFDKHINEIHRKVMGTLIYINIIKDYFDKDTRKVVVQSLGLNILNNCNTTRGTTNTTLLNKAQKLLNFAAIVIDGK